MPIEFVHFLSGVIVVGTVSLIFRRKLTHFIFYTWALFTFMLPDLDHFLFWNSRMIAALFPKTLEDLYKDLFSTRHPLFLHYWLFPVTVSVVAAYGRQRGLKAWKYIAILAVGWAVHIALDGVMLF